MFSRSKSAASTASVSSSDNAPTAPPEPLPPAPPATEPKPRRNSGVMPESAPSSAVATVTRTRKAPDLASVDRRNWLIHLHFTRKEYDQCRRLIELQVKETQGKCEVANYTLAMILRQEGKIQESLELFQSCAVLNPSNVENLKQAARSLYLLGRHKAASEIYLEAESYSHQDWEISHNLGEFLTQGKCVDSTSPVVPPPPESPPSRTLCHQLVDYGFSRMNLIANDPRQSLTIKHGEFPPDPALCNQFLTLHFQDLSPVGPLQAVLAGGAMIQAHQDFDAALTKYRLATERAPDSGPLWNNIGMCFYGNKKYVAAITCLKRAHYLAPFDWKILYNLGLVHQTMQQYASAFHFLSAAANLKPNKGVIYSLLGSESTQSPSFLGFPVQICLIISNFLSGTLTHLDDPDNANKAFQEALNDGRKQFAVWTLSDEFSSLVSRHDSKDPLAPLNYASFLMNQGDKTAAICNLRVFEERVVQFRRTHVVDIDPDILEAATKLAESLETQLFFKNSEQRPPSSSSNAMTSAAIHSSKESEAVGGEGVSEEPPSGETPPLSGEAPPPSEETPPLSGETPPSSEETSPPAQEEAVEPEPSTLTKNDEDDADLV
ncbi:unnamed protein product [Cyprideis torosa]|uniref:Uncharacterized protein n=1 Tax=Cyprideis torosa TaxID=163714 RepID=A0A7R8W3Q5_9CRUS|nr:unnamed protein product [Cyprideis torosa]CAG0879160.1 unnamed protein product [Cyprideis torosa]